MVCRHDPLAFLTERNVEVERGYSGLLDNSFQRDIELKTGINFCNKHSRLRLMMQATNYV